jgi:spermidine synthase
MEIQESEVQRIDNASSGTLLLLSVFTVATCGLIYELVAGTLASYLLGDSVMQFSTIIGCYLFAMGIGSWLSKYFLKNLLGWFIQVEILVGVIGGLSSAILFLLFAYIEHFRIILYALVLITGILVGLEIPLLMRVLKSKYAFHDLVSKIFTFDYIGALLASLIFPLFLVPHLGLIRTSVFFGILNVIVAIIVATKFENNLPSARFLKSAGWVSLFGLLAVFVFADRITSFSESHSIPGKIIHAESSPYQRIILSSDGSSLRLYLNGNLQFSSDDEYRYHESLVHPAMQSTQTKNKVLVLGGGDGLAVR